MVLYGLSGTREDTDKIMTDRYKHFKFIASSDSNNFEIDREDGYEYFIAYRSC